MILDSQGNGIVDGIGQHDCDEANAARIVACVNACDGMQDPAKEIKRLKFERDALINKLKRLHDNNALSHWGDFEVEMLLKEMGVEL
jgi:hypothetical protein